MIFQIKSLHFLKKETGVSNKQQKLDKLYKSVTIHEIINKLYSKCHLQEYDFQQDQTSLRSQNV